MESKRFIKNPEPDLILYSDACTKGCGGHIKDGTSTGLESLRTIPPCKTLVGKTPTGGLHIILKLPAGVQVGNRTNFLPNIDIRGHLGYIVAPGSTIGDKAYELQNPDVPIAMIPPDLLLKIGVKSSDNDLENDFGAVRADFSDIPESVLAGGRDDTVYKFCCSWRARSLTREQAVVRLRELFNVIEQPTGDLFTWAEAMAKLDQAWSLPAGTPQDQVVAAVTPDLQAPVETVMTFSQMLIQYVFVENGSYVGDLNTRAVVKLGDFKNRMKPVRERGANDRMIEVANMWMASRARQEVFDTVYYPDIETPIIDKHRQKFFNTYRGPDLQVVNCDLQVIDPFVNHVKYLMPNPVHHELWFNWAAFTVQYPGERIPWCFLIVTTYKGVGKQPIFDMMAKCVGTQNAIQVTKQALSDNNSFNDFMSEKKIVGFDEVHLQGMDFDKLKYLITAPEVEINHKYGAKRKEAIYANFLMFTNHADALKIEHGDRRFFVTHCRDEAKLDPDYYANLFHLIHKTNMPAHFLAWLKARDLSGFKHGQAPPMTEAKQHMYEVTADDLETDIEGMVADGLGPCMFDIVSSGLLYDYLSISDTHTNISKRSIANHLAQASPPDARLRQTQYRVPDTKAKRLVGVRCKCIRNASKWAKAEPAAVVLEYLRAREAVADTKTKKQIIEDVHRAYEMEGV